VRGCDPKPFEERREKERLDPGPAIRVDRSADPLSDLHALLDASDAFEGFFRAVDTLMAGDATTSLACADEALLVGAGASGPH